MLGVFGAFERTNQDTGAILNVLVRAKGRVPYGDGEEGFPSISS